MHRIVPQAWNVCLLLVIAVPGAHGQCTDQALQLAHTQLNKTLAYTSTTQFPHVTVPPTNQWSSTDATDWASGFFPGWIWYLYEHQDNSLLARAQAQTASLAGEATDASSHDVGFRIMCSYGNGYNFTGDQSYMSVIQTAAQTLSTLYVSFPDGTGTINSWPYWNRSKTNVIIDNMMNLELLFYAAQHGGNPAWRDMAVNHALKTMQNLVRDGSSPQGDGSTYQGVEYNADGSVYTFFNSDGYSVNSTWALGQTWGLYGFTMSYRYTGDSRFLNTAERIANNFISRLPADWVPYWDSAAGAPPYRDSGAAAVAAAGLLELSTYVQDPSLQAYYYNAAMNIQSSLSSPSYLADPTTSDGILLHAHTTVNGSDTSDIWADYYFIEGCYRAKTTPAPPDFSLSASPASLSLSQSGSATSSITVSALGGFAGNITLSATSSPSGLAAAFSPATVTAPGTSIMTLTAAGVPAGNYTLTITGSSGPLIRTSTVAVTVTPSGSFTLTANPTSLSVQQGKAAQTSITVTSSGGFTGGVNLTVSGLPRRVTATFSPSSNLSVGPNTTGKATLSIQTSASSPTGSYSITVAGAASGVPGAALTIPLVITSRH